LNLDPPDLCLLSSWDYRREHRHLARKEDLEFEVNLGTLARPHLKTKRTGHMAEVQSTCLARTRPWVQTQ
jgi:hypothetical protein